MCRNIRPLFNFDPPATGDEIRAASSLVTSAAPRDRAEAAARAKARSAARFAQPKAANR
jgi:hypothetical protein